ncbi:MAG: hypothetical protein RIR00_2192, partial [Pseudomonadota bacterium]|jgi:topoisomerase-4 subunit A
VEFQHGGKLSLAQTVQPEAQYLVASDAGYGFRCRGEDLVSRGKAGKAFMSLGDGEQPAIFMPAPQGEVACCSGDGRVLVFAAEDIKALPKGKGVKLIEANPGRTALEAILPVQDGQAGKLSGERLAACRGSRGSLGRKPRGGAR